jgi:ABC-type bacteriocin/lantibiotic exporter with double-glycine peptidase domain
MKFLKVNVLIIAAIVLLQSAVFAQHQDFISILNGPIPKVEAFEPVAPSPELLCGINCLYLTLKIFHENVGYNNILKAFPDAAKNGTSLQQIQAYLMEKGYKCDIQKINDVALRENGGDVVAIILLQQSTGFHIILKKSQMNPDGITVIDPPNTKHFLPSANLSTEPHVTLLVSKSPISGGTYPKQLLVCFFLGISIFSGCLYLYLNKHDSVQ